MANILPRLFNFAKFSLNTGQLHSKQAILPNSLINTLSKCNNSSQPTPYEIVDEGQDYKLVKGKGQKLATRAPLNLLALFHRNPGKTQQFNSKLAARKTVFSGPCGW